MSDVAARTRASRCASARAPARRVGERHAPGRRRRRARRGARRAAADAAGRDAARRRRRRRRRARGGARRPAWRTGPRWGRASDGAAERLLVVLAHAKSAARSSCRSRRSALEPAARRRPPEQAAERKALGDAGRAAAAAIEAASWLPRRAPLHRRPLLARGRARVPGRRTGRPPPRAGASSSSRRAELPLPPTLQLPRGRTARSSAGGSSAPANAIAPSSPIRFAPMSKRCDGRARQRARERGRALAPRCGCGAAAERRVSRARGKNERRRAPSAPRFVSRLRERQPRAARARQVRGEPLGAGVADRVVEQVEARPDAGSAVASLGALGADAIARQVERGHGGAGGERGGEEPRAGRADVGVAQRHLEQAQVDRIRQSPCGGRGDGRVRAARRRRRRARRGRRRRARPAAAAKGARRRAPAERAPSPRASSSPPSPHARSIRRSPALSTRWRSAPAAISATTHSAWPASAARNSGVCPLKLSGSGKLLVQFAGTPCSISSTTIRAAAVPRASPRRRAARGSRACRGSRLPRERSEERASGAAPRHNRFPRARRTNGRGCGGAGGSGFACDGASPCSSRPAGGRRSRRSAGSPLLIVALGAARASPATACGSVGAHPGGPPALAAGRARPPPQRRRPRPPRATRRRARPRGRNASSAASAAARNASSAMSAARNASATLSSSTELYLFKRTISSLSPATDAAFLSRYAGLTLNSSAVYACANGTQGHAGAGASARARGRARRARVRRARRARRGRLVRAARGLARERRRARGRGRARVDRALVRAAPRRRAQRLGGARRPRAAAARGEERNASAAADDGDDGGGGGDAPRARRARRRRAPATTPATTPAPGDDAGRRRRAAARVQCAFGRRRSASTRRTSPTL